MKRPDLAGRLLPTKSAGPRRNAALAAKASFHGAHEHPTTGASFAYAGSCQLVINNRGQESMHLQGTISSGATESVFAANGIVDHRRSFVGREREAALEWVKGLCDPLADGKP